MTMQSRSRNNDDLSSEDFSEADEEEFEYPSPPEYIGPSILEEAEEWRGLNEFDVLVKLEEKIKPLEADIKRIPLSSSFWGFTYVSREYSRCRIHLNSRLPVFWQTFALFHEIHHLLHDSRGCYFWSQTLANMNGFEYQADQFAWAVMLDDDSDDGEVNW